MKFEFAALLLLASSFEFAAALPGRTVDIAVATSLPKENPRNNAAASYKAVKKLKGGPKQKFDFQKKAENDHDNFDEEDDQEEHHKGGNKNNKKGGKEHHKRSEDSLYEQVVGIVKRGIDTAKGKLGKGGKSGRESLLGTSNKGKPTNRKQSGSSQLADNLEGLFGENDRESKRQYGTPTYIEGMKKGTFDKHPLHKSGGDSARAHDASVARNNEKVLGKRSAMNVFSFIGDELMEIPSFAEEDNEVCLRFPQPSRSTLIDE